MSNKNVPGESDRSAHDTLHGLIIIRFDSSIFKSTSSKKDIIPLDLDHDQNNYKIIVGATGQQGAIFLSNCIVFFLGYAQRLQ